MPIVYRLDLSWGGRKKDSAVYGKSTKNKTTTPNFLTIQLNFHHFASIAAGHYE